MWEMKSEDWWDTKKKLCQVAVQESEFATFRPGFFWEGFSKQATVYESL